MRCHIVRGVVDISELTNCLKEIYNSSDLDPDMNVFWDLQKADLSRISTEEVSAFMKYVSSQWGAGGTSKAALVVSRDLEYGMSRMYEMMMGGATSSKIAVFRDIDKAKEWIEAEI